MVKSVTDSLNFVGISKKNYKGWRLNLEDISRGYEVSKINHWRFQTRGVGLRAIRS